MKIIIVGQIENKKTGLGKALDDIIQFANESQEITEVDITNNKLFFRHIFKLLTSHGDVFYFTPAGSKFGVLRDSIYLLCMILRRKKIILHFHNSNFGSTLKNSKLLSSITRFLYRRIDRIILLGDAQKQMFLGLKVPNEKFFIVRNGIDEALFISEGELKQKHQNSKKVVAYFSNMLEAKGYKQVLEVAKTMESNQNLEFRFAGKFFDEDLQKDFFEKIRGLTNVIYYPGVYGEDKKKFLRDIHFFVLPSEEEVLPISMLEAMANGAYIIVSDVGVIKEVLAPETSSLLRERERQEIVDIIMEKRDTLGQLDYQIEKLKSQYSNREIQKQILAIIVE